MWETFFLKNHTQHRVYCNSLLRCDYRRQSPVLFQNIFKFCTFFTKFSNILPFFWKIAPIPLLSRINLVNCGGDPLGITRPLFTKWRLNSLKSYTVCFYCMPSLGSLKLSCRKLAFTSYKVFFFLKKKKRERALELVSLPHFLHNFWQLTDCRYFMRYCKIYLNCSCFFNQVVMS